MNLLVFWSQASYHFLLPPYPNIWESCFLLYIPHSHKIRIHWLRLSWCVFFRVLWNGDQVVAFSFLFSFFSFWGRGGEFHLSQQALFIHSSQSSIERPFASTRKTRYWEQHHRDSCEEPSSLSAGPQPRSWSVHTHFVSLHYHNSNILLAENFKLFICCFPWLHNVCKVQVFLHFLFTSIQWNTSWLQHQLPFFPEVFWHPLSQCLFFLE